MPEAAFDRRTVEQIDVDAVERAGQRALRRAQLAAVVEGDGVEAERLRVVLPAVAEALAELHVLGVEEVAFDLACCRGSGIPTSASDRDSAAAVP